MWAFELNAIPVESLDVWCLYEPWLQLKCFNLHVIFYKYIWRYLKPAFQHTDLVTREAKTRRILSIHLARLLHEIGTDLELFPLKGAENEKRTLPQWGMLQHITLKGVITHNGSYRVLLQIFAFKGDGSFYTHRNEGWLKLLKLWTPITL